MEGEKNMKFKDKLPKLRKEQNLSQEQLADRLGVSRQAVSKWESGQSYPDMNKMIEIASTLDTTLDKLLDDGALGDPPKEEKTSKPKDYLYSFLNFITKSVNMFFSMTFKEKVVCIFEMAMTTLILALISYIVYAIIVVCIEHIFFFIPYQIRYYIFTIIEDLALLVMTILAIITIIHIFKLRYLDYYITIEDDKVGEKTIEEEIKLNSETKDKHIIPTKPKVIIRDPKHTSDAFIKCLGKLLNIFLKGVLIFILLPLILSFILILILASFAIYHLNLGLIALYVLLTLLGAIILNYLLIKIIYNFIFNLKSSFKKTFYIFIIGLILIGIFSGLTITTYLNYKPIKIDYNNKDFITDTREITFKDNLIIPFIMEGTTEIKIDNNQENIKIEVSHLKGPTYNIYTYSDTYYDKDYVTYNINCYYNSDQFTSIENLLEDIKKKQRRNYILSNTYKVTITTSLDNLNKLKENLTTLY